MCPFVRISAPYPNVTQVSQKVESEAVYETREMNVQCCPDKKKWP